MPQPLPPCRLYTILARDAPVSVIFRRGPSRRVQVIRWDTATDTFTPGQWFHGRIYEKRCDLSPNGRLMIYAAMKPAARARIDPAYTESWTAISKPPFLTALALWPCLSSVGGGLFISDTKVWLNHYGHPEPHPDHLPKGLKVENDENNVLEKILVNRRLERDGWKQTQEWLGGMETYGYVTRVPEVHRKQNPQGMQNLILTTSITGFKSRDIYTVHYADGKELALVDATWADWDQRGRLVFARAGKIFGLPADEIGQEEAHELIDLNGNTPEPMVAPEWAKVW